MSNYKTQSGNNCIARVVFSSDPYYLSREYRIFVYLHDPCFNILFPLSFHEFAQRINLCNTNRTLFEFVITTNDLNPAANSFTSCCYSIVILSGLKATCFPHHQRSLFYNWKSVIFSLISKFFTFLSSYPYLITG